MTSIPLGDEEINEIWTVYIEKSCAEFMLMQESKTAKDLLYHKQKKELYDSIVKSIKPFRFS